MAYHLIFLPYGDWEEWYFEHFVSGLQFCLSAEGAKKVGHLPLIPSIFRIFFKSPFSLRSTADKIKSFGNS